MNEKVLNGFNDQINAELYSEYLYLSMAAYFESAGFRGMANWMRIQAGEEHMHAMKFFSFILDRSSRVKLAAIDAPKVDWKNPLEAFSEAYQHELKISGLINNLASIAVQEKDHAAHNFLQWFVTEQVEEESNALTIVDELKLVGDNGLALYTIDKELGARVPSPGVPNADAKLADPAA